MVVMKITAMFLFCHAYEKKIRCTRLEAQVEVSANQSGTLNESKPKAQHEFSERDKQKTFIATSFNINYRDFAQVMVYL